LATAAVFALVPEAEACVAQLRERFDPAARRGLGAHVTILYPFAPPGIVTEDMLRQLAGLAGAIAPFRFALTHVARFPGTVYLAPEPASRFVRLHEACAAAFPGDGAAARQPYVPHLSVARHGQGEDHGVEAELSAMLKTQGPIECRCRELVLMENGSGLWRAICTFTLGTGARAP
jgi:2'-5' RNA ligase